MLESLCCLYQLFPFLCFTDVFFVFIPGAVIDKVSDTMTGAKGSNCIREDVKVGDKVYLPDGSVGTITEISGKSSRCKDPNMPIRAVLELSKDKGFNYSSPYQSQSSVRCWMGNKATQPSYGGLWNHPARSKSD